MRRGGSIRLIRAWLSRWGFAVLVGSAALVAAFVAWRVEIPAEIPTFALEAAPVYRLEVGAASFLGIYLVSMAFVLALNNRGFSEIGTHGLKAQDLANRGNQQAIRGHEETLSGLEGALAESERFAVESVVRIEARLDAIETAADSVAAEP